MATVVFGALSLKWPDKLLTVGFLLWLPVQAAWLFWASPESVSVFLLLGGALGAAIDTLVGHLQDRSPQFGAIELLSWTTLAMQLAGYAGVFLFAYELRRYLRRTDGYEPAVSYIWAFLFSMYYFQYKLHELYEDQVYRESRITPGSG